MFAPNSLLGQATRLFDGRMHSSGTAIAGLKLCAAVGTAMHHHVVKKVLTDAHSRHVSLHEKSVVSACLKSANWLSSLDACCVL